MPNGAVSLFRPFARKDLRPNISLKRLGGAYTPFLHADGTQYLNRCPMQGSAGPVYTSSAATRRYRPAVCA